MDFKKVPIAASLAAINYEPDALKAFNNILGFGRTSLPSNIWDTFTGMSLTDDIKKASEWIQATINKFPGTNGIYFGLDTLNMNSGKGSNIEIGLSEDCDPHEISDEWTYDCDNYGKSHLIKGLFNVEDSFNNEQLWTSEERDFTEYLVFLSYSGLVLREALSRVKFKNDFISIWGFHDGDSFYLVQKTGNEISPIINANF